MSHFPGNELHKGNILIVDDCLLNLQPLPIILDQHGYQVREVNSGLQALQDVTIVLPDLILLDIQMPEMNGYEVCAKLKANAQTQDIPIIFLSASEGVSHKLSAFDSGGVDYITKPFDIAEVLVRIEHQLAFQRLQQQLKMQNKRLQQEIAERLLAEAEVRRLNAELETRIQIRTAELEEINRNLTQEVLSRKSAQEKLMYMTLYDGLTNLPNRAFFLDRLKQALAQAKSDNQYQFAVLVLDCDRFKVINDSLGYLLGDLLINTLGQRLANYLRQSDLLARLGGDEFGLLLSDTKDISEVTKLVEHIQQGLTQPFLLNNCEIFVNMSIGIVFVRQDYDQPEHVLRDANIAMYRAKLLRQGSYQIYSATMHYEAIEMLYLEADLRHALEHQEFLVYYQPIVSLVTGQIVSFEALIRWQHPKRGMIHPVKFITVAEETGLIKPIGEWVIQEACRQLDRWQKKYNPALSMHINLSVKQFLQPTLLHRIDQILAEAGVIGKSVVLEITETALMEDSAKIMDLLTQLRVRQINLALDDFGTGYSSLSYLHQFPINTLKIDRSFVSRVGPHGENLEIVRAIVTLAHALGINVVAEGIESLAQLKHLQELHCEFGQGHLFAHTLSAEAAERLLKHRVRWHDFL